MTDGVERPQTHIRWVCEQCEYEENRERPTSVLRLKNDTEQRSCPTCGNGSSFKPFPILQNGIHMARSNGHPALANIQPETVSGDTVEDALDGHEVGTHLSQGHPIVDPAEDPHACVCDWCDGEISAGDSVTAYAYRHPEHDDPEGWYLFELYCEDCDVATLLLGGQLTDDVLVHGHISTWGDMYTLEDTQTIHRREIGERVDLDISDGVDDD